jgi:hypothetical protein
MSNVHFWLILLKKSQVLKSLHCQNAKDIFD